MITDQQPCHHNGNRSGKVQAVGQRKSTGNQSQCNQYLDLVIFHAFQHPIGNATDEQAEDQSTNGFFYEQPGHRSWGHAPCSGGNFQYDQKHHHRNAIVKQRFTGNFNFEARGYTRFF